MKEIFLSNLELIINDYRIEDCGSPLEINYEIIDKIIKYPVSKEELKEATYN